MKPSVSRVGVAVLSFLAAGVVGLGGLAAAPRAGAVPVEVNMTTLRAIQTLALDKEKGADQAYLLVNGVANGKEFAERLPKEKTWTVAPKKPVGSDKAPVALWKGDLGDGEFALVTVTLMQGKGADEAKIKQYLEQKAEAEKKAAERAMPKLTQADFDKLHEQTLKAQQKFIEGIKKIFPREPNTDHFGGLFTITIWNNGGKIAKRLDPVGLTFGDHYGVDPKIYTKIKNTRANVMVKDEATGEWSVQQFMALSDEQDAIRVKMLENEMVTPPGGKEQERNTVDYLAEIQVKADGKVLKWELGGEQPGGDDNLHIYWDFAQ